MRMSESRRGLAGRIAVVTCVAGLLLLAVALANGCGEGKSTTLTINEFKLKQSDLPGWTLTREVKGTRGSATAKNIIAQLFDAGAVGVIDQVFDKNGTGLQVNYVQMKDTDGANQAAVMLKDVPGTTNTIGVKNNIAVEIIGSPADKQLVVKNLGLDLQ